jgi:iron complex outermembrane receptor protein
MTNCTGRRRLMALLTATAAMAWTQAWAGAPAGGSEDLTNLSLEQLMQLEVTSVSKRPERLSDAAAAIYVITQEDIRRSGATSIPEALRLAPGIEVARIDSSKWAITSRGFNSRFANKLLVLIDGRSVYTPLFSGVFWDQQDTLLADVERIEVIRGPGATLWGANAVNGVINIITKPAAQTQGSLVSGALGTDRASLAARHGARLGENTALRVFGKGFSRDAGRTAVGEGEDEWRQQRGGFRLDSQPTDADSVTVSGEAFAGSTGETFLTQTLTPPFSLAQSDDTETTGGHLLGRWDRKLSEQSSASVQAYYGRTNINDPRIVEARDTFDIEAQHDVALGERHRLIWGLGYRVTADEVDSSPTIVLDPDSRTSHLFSGFAQDTITLIPNELDLTLGTKLEHNDFTGFEVQPNARLSWLPTANQTVWAAVSRAVRTPSRAEADVAINQMTLPPGTAQNPSALPAFLRAIGNRDFGSEELVAYEAGYRIQVDPQLTFDLAAFYNNYDDLRGARLGSPFLELSPLPPHLVVPALGDNVLEGQTYGFEVVADWRPRAWWRLQGTYSLLQVELHSKSGAAPMAEIEEGYSPQQQAALHSYVDLSETVTFDTSLRFVDQLSTLGVPSYLTLDARLGWRAAPGLEVALVGRNLLDDAHPEFGSETLASSPTEAERSAFVTVQWRF